MNIAFEKLEKIEEIYNLLVLLRDREMNKIEKRWLTTEELCEYIGYSKESIKNMIKNEEFVIDLHYYKKHRKNIFDKTEIDKWIMGSNKTNTNNYELLANRILKNVA
ncbi:helix-turn-helix transcriptional regulator [Arcobacter aquimarinus]|uniref:helix-turn-helix transcriptional regulator n=1 Tax=Arcobacter aquimarinus TaxID=1315211 RepID=UPI003BAEFCD5